MLSVPLSHIGLVALGGAFGAAARFLVAGAVAERAAHGFPWGTFAVNVAGSFLIGVLAMLTAEQAPVSRTRLLLITGVLGGFTTFSAFSLELTEMLADRRFGAVAAYSFGSVAACLGATMFGALLVRGLAR